MQREHRFLPRDLRHRVRSMERRGRDGGTAPRKRGAGRSISPAGHEVQTRGKRGESPAPSSGKRSRSSASYGSDDSFGTAGSAGAGQPQLVGGGSLPPPPPPTVGNVGYVRPSWLPGIGPNTPLPPPPPPFVPLQRKRDQPKEINKDKDKKDKDQDDTHPKAIYAADPEPQDLDSDLDVGSDYSRRTPTAPPMQPVAGEDQKREVLSQVAPSVMRPRALA